MVTAARVEPRIPLESRIILQPFLEIHQFKMNFELYFMVFSPAFPYLEVFGKETGKTKTTLESSQKSLLCSESTGKSKLSSSLEDPLLRI